VLLYEDAASCATYIAREYRSSKHGLGYKIYVLLSDEELIQGWGHSISIHVRRDGEECEVSLVHDPDNPFGQATGRKTALLDALRTHAEEIVDVIVLTDPFLSSLKG
jgi:hypothetical protein